MGAQSNLAPIIIKRKKVIAGGHHGGAWKVAYADFVTAMMAFFMMMWLLNATTEQQRSGLADYFSPTVPINRISGGGDGSFGGDSMFSEDTLPQSGLGASAEHATQKQQSRGDTGMAPDGGEQDQSDVEFEALIAELVGRGGESEVMDNLLKHIVTRITDEGLVIELFSRENAPLFASGTAEPTQLLEDLVSLVAGVSQAVKNSVAVGGHVRAFPLVVAENPVWDTSSRRADLTRNILEREGVVAERIQRVTGHADREPVVEDRMAARNERVEIVLLR
ncbi:flagellar motor protein MotB [uncultured Roseobacter sp.]|uniref:flagellar motor protein MotB n=1 Tax=uncultured Roseobacter sp. TaxID=114847 RepID=UPI00261829C0|nr:flagellar motor protein MotB [uncultured Roseobacter sp.]